MPGDRPPTLFRRPSDWLAVSCVGAILLAIGIYRPANDWIPSPIYYGTSLVAVGLAVAGGIAWMYGLGRWYDARPNSPAQRRRPPTRVDMSRASNLSSFEVYGTQETGAPGNKRP